MNLINKKLITELTFNLQKKKKKEKKKTSTVAQLLISNRKFNAKNQVTKPGARHFQHLPVMALQVEFNLGFNLGWSSVFQSFPYSGAQTEIYGWLWYLQ